jgi:gliding-associated putative ABC transporter substrate-binding component GldG
MKNKLYISVVMVLVILLIVNLISQDLFFRLDFTENNQYTLSRATKNLLKNLNEPVTIKAYYSEDLPQEEINAKNEFKDLLVEYNRRSKGMVVYSFVNPNEKEEVGQEAEQAGISPRSVPTNLKDQFKIQKIYSGAVISIGERKEVLPVVPSGIFLEFTLSKAIKKLSIQNKPSVGLLQGHGEPSLQDIIQVYNELSVLYNVNPLTLSDTANIPENLKTIIIIQPKDTIPEKHFAQLNNFLSRGGKIFVAFSRANQQNVNVSSTTCNLAAWIKRLGINIKDDVVYDKNCPMIQVSMQGGGYMIVKLPYIPIATNFAKHPISSGLANVVFPFPSSIEYTGDPLKKFTPIVLTSNESGTENLPVYINFERNWDFSGKNIVLAATLEGKLVGESESKMVIVSDGKFIINENPNQPQQMNPDNINLIANSIDWLSDDTGLIELRNKTITAKPVDNISDSTKSTLKWLNFLLPILLAIAYGFIRFQINRNKRIKRMEESYV